MAQGQDAGVADAEEVGEVGVVRPVFYIQAVPGRHHTPNRLVLLPFLALLGLMLGPILGAAQALAACTDPPGPGVDWRRCSLDGRDLSGADLSGMQLRDASLQRTQLVGAKLVGAEGSYVRFVSSDLNGADLTGATLREADFTRATLRGAKLVRADLRRARLFRADLTEADLTGAMLGGTDFTGVILDGATWTDGTRICAAGSVGSCQ